MAKTKKIEVKKVERPKPEVKPLAPKTPKKRYFSKFAILVSLCLIAVAIISYLKMYTFPKLAFEVILLLTGLWVLKGSIKAGFKSKRKDIFKKYI